MWRPEGASSRPSCWPPIRHSLLSNSSCKDSDNGKQTGGVIRKASGCEGQTLPISLDVRDRLSVKVTLRFEEDARHCKQDWEQLHTQWISNGLYVMWTRHSKETRILKDEDERESSALAESPISYSFHGSKTVALYIPKRYQCNWSVLHT